MNPIFGFKGVRGRVENDVLNHRSRLVLDSAGLNGQVVLDEPWMSGNLFRHDKDANPDNYYNRDYLGYEWYITINIRRNNPNDYSYSDENVLKIEMPYILGMNADSALIVFDSIPYSYPLTTVLPNNRGIAQRLNGSRANCFYIKKSMLPFNCKDITISARFRLNGLLSEGGNYKLKKGMVTYDTTVIDTLKIRVTYYNTCAVALDFIRIESPNSQRYFRGFHDDKIISSIQTDLINFSDETLYKNRGIKLFRFNSFIEGSYQDWAAERYFNKLIGNINVSEDNYSILPAHFEYFVNPPERWLGTWQVRNAIPAPYSRRVYDKDSAVLVKTMGIINGYNGRINGNIETDSSKVHYETYLVNKGDGVDLDHFLNNPIDIAEYEQVMNTQNNWSRSSFQTYVEDHLYTHFLKETAKGFLFSDKFWWNQGFIHLSWSTESYNNTDYTRYSHRPLTGEEFRLFASLGVLLGAKGLFYDGAESIISNYDKQQFYDYEFLTSNQRTTLNNMTDEEFLDSDLAGPDFIRTSNEIMNLNDRLYDLDTIAKYLDRPANKLYIGRRSLRKEMKRLHDQIRRCEDELMKLRLVAWMGKGYRLWNNHHPDYPDDSTFRRFLAWDTTRNMVDTTRFKSWPIGRYDYRPELLMDPPGYPPIYEPWDSTFIDFTLLKDKDTSINDLAYVGIQNRRTNSLVCWEQVVPNSFPLLVHRRIQFYSTAEFEDSCDAIKNPTCYQAFRNYYYCHLGSRQITLPFNYVNPNNPDEYALLRITELGADSVYDDNWSYSRKMAYWNRIDTVIGQDKSITFNMLPGSGIILKVQILHPDTSVAGVLAHSNQSKLIMHPVLDEEGNETDIIRYHLVYFKPIVGNPNTNGVYYRRSLPISKDCPEENIIWEPEILVSDSTINETGRINNLVSCDYPSIVVRKDSVSLKAYIVFSCFKNRSRSFVAETKLDVNTSGLVQDNNGYELALYNGNNRAEWGNPVVNASSNGNYYAWSDSLSGIYAGWKTPNTATFQSGNKISFKYDYNPLVIAKHPSLNVYSNLDSLEDNCALVWQENQTNLFSAPNRILYTRLRRTNNLYKYLPATFLGNPSLIEISNNVASIYNSLFIVQNPVISRKLGYYRKSGVEALCRRYDLIYWELANSYYSPALNFLSNMLIYNYDTNNVAINWNAFGANYIRSYFSVINSPDIIHQTRLDDTYSTGGDVILNFKYARNLAYPYVGQFSYSSNSYASSGSLDSSDINDLWVKSVGSGFLPHLSKSKNLIEKTNDTWKNRRVYNNNLGRIITSAKYFYKGRSDEMLADWYIGFETADSSKKSFLFGAPELDEQRFSLKLPFEKVVSDEGYISFVETSSDTIASSWFSIEDAKELALKLKGSNNANSKVYIQNKETERTLRLNLPNGLKENKGAKAKYNLINGLGNEFRLLFVKNDEAMQYTEELWLEGLPIEEKPAGSFKGDDGFENIDLIQIVNRYYSDNDISIFPNPASEVLYLQANVPFEE
ncbi:MAG TPA: hypothetical protein PKY56_07335, partial [Candidatus Kapabacteria bacterium]|nr:hypothetical protein [Candidatus Kapabacteria bacterium]